MYSNQYQNAVISWWGEKPQSQCLAVTLTMKQLVDQQKLDRYAATQNLRHCLNQVNRELFGNAARRYNKKIDVVPFQHRSATKRLHYHLIMRVPESVPASRLKETVIGCWKHTRFGLAEHAITNAYAPERWISYMINRNSQSPKLDIENICISR